MEIIHFHSAGIVAVAARMAGQSDVVPDGSNVDDKPAGLHQSEGVLVRYRFPPSIT